MDERPRRQRFDSVRFAQPSDVLDIVLDHISQGMVVVGPDYRTLAFNQRFEDMFQLPHGAVEVGTDFRDILHIWARETGQGDAMLERAIRELDLPYTFEFEFPQDIQGAVRWCLLTHNPIPGNGFVRTFTDITDRKKLEEQLLRLSQTDSLTGIANRRAILDALERELARFCRHPRDLSVLTLDLDHFKKVNDTWGHPAGDETLRRFVTECTSAMRLSDQMGRLGGEEFLIILAQTRADDALQLAERLRRTVGDMRIRTPDDQHEFSVTVSIGITSAQVHDSVETLIQRADRALYAAKSAGRNRVASLQH